jgi:hypothetical protein
VPSGVGRWAPLRTFVERPGTVPLLHFSLGFKDSGWLLARLLRLHRGGSEVGSLPPSSFSSPLPRPPRAAHVQRGLAPHGPAEAFPRSLGAAGSTRTSTSVLLGASHPNPALRPEGQGVESERPGFLTRRAPFLPRRVEVLFQTGNTPGVAPPSPAGHVPQRRIPACGVPGRIRRPFPAVARWRLPTRLSPRGWPRLPAGRVGVATTFFLQFSMSAE